MDINDFNTEDTAEMVVSLNGKPTEWVWEFAGPGHAKTIAVGNKISREELAEQRLKEQAQVNGKKWKASNESPDEVREKHVGIIIDRLLGWRVDGSSEQLTMGGEPFPFNEVNARKILSDRSKTTLLSQALEFLGDDDSFMHRSAPNSKPTQSVNSNSQGSKTA